MIYHDKQLNKEIEIDNCIASYNRKEDIITVQVIKDDRVFDTLYLNTCLEISDYFK